MLYSPQANPTICGLYAGDMANCALFPAMIAALVLQQHRLMDAHKKYLFDAIDIDNKKYSTHVTYGHISSRRRKYSRRCPNTTTNIQKERPNATVNGFRTVQKKMCPNGKNASADWPHSAMQNWQALQKYCTWEGSNRNIPLLPRVVVPLNVCCMGDTRKPI